MKSKYWIPFFGALFFPSFVFATSKIIISEIGACESGDSEWIEVWNISEENIDLTEWKFYEQGSNHSINEVDGGAILNANTRAVIVDKKDDFLTVFPEFTGQLFDSSWGSLKNTGEEITLKDETGAIDTTEQFTYPECETGKSLERTASNADPTQSTTWQSANDSGTPGAINVAESQEETEEEPEEESSEITFVSGTATVKINEIQAHNVDETEEWFEFYLEGNEAVDISDWQVSNGSGTKKTFLSEKDKLVFVGGGQNLAGQEVILNSNGKVISENTEGTTATLDADKLIFLPENKAWFYWSQSPISLVNSGGTVEILDGSDVVLNTITYAEAKSGTSSGIEWYEVWNRHETKNTFFPLIYKNPEDQNYRHTQGAENHAPPTYAEDLELLISEASPDRKSETGPDFIELYVKSASNDPVNLKYLEIKHNGTSLYTFETDFLVNVGEFLVIKLGQAYSGIVTQSSPYEIYTDKKDGLSSGSGTVEVILFSGTSFETTEDFLCWKDETLSQTEATRVTNNVTAGNWSGDCVEIGELIDNESVARNIDYSDSGTLNDFFRHFNGSEGITNNPQNSTPTANIRVQGSGKTSGTPTFSMNLTGEDSTDPDGDHDLATFEWKINGTVFSTKENPSNYKIHETGPYEIIFTVTDYSGSTDSTTLEVIVVDPSSVGGIVPKIDRPLKTWVKKMLETPAKKTVSTKTTKTVQTVRNKRKLRKDDAPDDFFQTFLDRMDEKTLQKILNQKTSPSISKSPLLPFVRGDTRENIFKRGFGDSQYKQKNHNISSIPSKKTENTSSTPFAKRKTVLPPQIRKKAAKNIGFIFME